MNCERCKASPVGYALFDYCATCSKNLCPKCMAAGCCGVAPATSGNDADNSEAP
jgi:hypothetical protein